MDLPKGDTSALGLAVSNSVADLGPFVIAQRLQVYLALVQALQKAGDYPRMLYGPTGKTQTVVSQMDETRLGSDYSRVPTDAHRAGASLGAVASTNEAVAAELAMRRKASISDPTDSRVVLNAHDDDVSMTDSTTTRRPVGRPRIRIV